MASKIGRNEICPCGSGKKYKYCHGNVDNSADGSLRSVEMNYRYTSIILSPEIKSKTPRIVTNGELEFEQKLFPFMMIVEPLENGELEIKQLGWQATPPIADKEAVAHQLLTQLARCLEPLIVKAVHDESAADGIDWKHLEPGDDLGGLHLTTLRPALSRLPGPDWSTLWERISLKVGGDASFVVSGFSQAEVVEGFKQLQQIFTADWVRMVMEQALGEGDSGKVTMATEFPHDASDAWFPAYHLSRIAMGVICRDSALNALVHLGHALTELEGFVGLDDLKKALSARPALHHQVCLAAELFKQGKLSAVADTVNGDLKVSQDGQQFIIHSLEVSLENLASDLEKACKTSAGPNPVVLHAVVVETGWYQSDLAPVDELDNLVLPENVQAIVIGRRFIGLEGGRLKRNAQKIIANQEGLETVLDSLFAPSGDTIVREPCLNVGTYFYVP